MFYQMKSRGQPTSLSQPAIPISTLEKTIITIGFATSIGLSFDGYNKQEYAIQELNYAPANQIHRIRKERMNGSIEIWVGIMTFLTTSGYTFARVFDTMDNKKS